MRTCMEATPRDSIVLGELVELFESRAVGAILSRLDLESQSRRRGADVVPSGPVRQRPRDPRDLLIFDLDLDIRTTNALENFLTPKKIEPRMEHYAIGRLCAWSPEELAAELGPGTAAAVKAALAAVRLKLRGE